MSEPVEPRIEKSDGAAFQAEVKGTASADGWYRWRLWGFNAIQTVPMGHVVAQGQEQNRDEAKRQVVAALKEVIGTSSDP